MKQKISLRESLAEELTALAAEDERILAFTSDATGSANLARFGELFPDRLVQMGIAEQNEISVAAGISRMGFIPFVCAPAAFLSARSLEQIKVDIAYNQANVKVIGISGGAAYGYQGPSHHALSDLAAIMPLEDIRVFCPADHIQMKFLIRHIAETDGPVYLRIGRAAVPVLYGETETFEPGKAKMLRSGSDMTIISMGEVLADAAAAADQLTSEGYSVRVLDMFSLRPIDRNAVIRAALETGRILVAEEHTVINGLGAQVAQIVSENAPARVCCLGFPSSHYPAGSREEMAHYLGLDRDGICAAARKLMGETSARAWFASAREGARSVS